MAISVPFDGHNRHFSTPVDPDDVIHGKEDMFGFQNGIITYSCWKLTPAELAEIARTGEVWMAVRNGADPMRSTWMGSLSSIKRACLDYGPFWKRRQRLIEDKRERA